MGAILTDPHLDTRMITCVFLLMLTKLEYAGEVWGGNATFVKQLETVQVVAAKKILGCSSTTSNTVLRTKLGMYCCYGIPLGAQRAGVFCTLFPVVRSSFEVFCCSIFPEAS